MAVAMDTIMRGDTSMIVHAVAVDLHDLVAVAAGDTLTGEAAILVQRLRRLSHHVLDPPRRRSYR